MRHLECLTAKNLHQDSSLPNKTAISLRLENGETFSDERIVWYCRDLVNQTTQRKISAGVIKVKVDEWLERSKEFATANFQALRAALGDLDNYLTLRSHIVVRTVDS